MTRTVRLPGPCRLRRYLAPTGPENQRHQGRHAPHRVRLAHVAGGVIRARRRRRPLSSRPNLSVRRPHTPVSGRKVEQSPWPKETRTRPG